MQEGMTTAAASSTEMLSQQDSLTQPSRSSMSSIPVPAGATASNFSFGGNVQTMQSDQTSKSDAPGAGQAVTQHVQSPVHAQSSSVAGICSNLGFGATNSLMPSTSSFARPAGLPGTPGTSGTPVASHLIPPPAPPFTVSSSSPSPVAIPGMPPGPGSGNSTGQAQVYPTYASFLNMAAQPQGMWLQPPTMGVVPRPPFICHPGSYPLPVRGMPHHVQYSDSQPPGVAPLGSAGLPPKPTAAAGHQLVSNAGPQKEPPTGIESKTSTQEASNKTNSLDAWTAHKTETGIVYYYNALTGQSTYEKPPGFKGESDKIPVQPTPVSMEHLPGTDWALVTTNDGKKYYYNSKTKISSWQIPAEVAELTKKRDADMLAGVSTSGPSADSATEKEAPPSTLSTPAINNGGRDATPLRTSSAIGSASALDLIKKKLQDPGAPAMISLGTAASEANGLRAVDDAQKGVQNDNGKDNGNAATGDANISDSSSDSEEEDGGPTKEECIIQFKEMLKERGVAPFSKWEKELPRILFDPRFKAIPSHSARRALFEHYVKTRAEEERKEKRAAQKAAIECFKQLLDEASEDIDQNTDYQTFKRKWGSDPRFGALERKDQETLLNDRVLQVKRAAERKAREMRAAAAADFKSMLREREDITINSRWSRVKDSLRNDHRYKSVRHEDRELIFNEYISELRAAQEEGDRGRKAKLDEEEKLKERERELRKRKEREEQEMERVRLKVRRKEAIASYQALLVETIKDPQASWTESKPKLEKDPQGRATNPDLDPSDMEKLFRQHVKTLYERCAHDFKALLVEVITSEAASEQTEDGKTVLDSWSTAKRLLKTDPRYNKMPRKEREIMWRRYAEDMLRKLKSSKDHKEDKQGDAKTRDAIEHGRLQSGSKRERL